MGKGYATGDCHVALPFVLRMSGDEIHDIATIF